MKQDHPHSSKGQRPAPTGRYKKRLCLVLDCLAAHEFSNKTSDLMNLQHYVIQEKKLSEKEAIIMFSDVVRIVESLHKVSLQQKILSANWVPIFYNIYMQLVCFLYTLKVLSH